MIEALDEVFDAGGGGWVAGAVDEEDREAEGAGGGELGVGGGAAAVLGDEDVDAVPDEERALGGFGEGAAGEEEFGLRQGLGVGRVDGAEQVMVLGGGAEEAGFLAADREEDAGRGGAEGFRGVGEGRDEGPAVAGLRAARAGGRG